MALLKCKDCGGKVSSEAQACPHCGCPTPAKKTSQRKRVSNKTPNKSDFEKQYEAWKVQKSGGNEKSKYENWLKDNFKGSNLRHLKWPEHKAKILEEYKKWELTGKPASRSKVTSSIQKKEKSLKAETKKRKAQKDKKPWYADRGNKVYALRDDPAFTVTKTEVTKAIKKGKKKGEDYIFFPQEALTEDSVDAMKAWTREINLSYIGVEDGSEDIDDNAVKKLSNLPNKLIVSDELYEKLIPHKSFWKSLFGRQGKWVTKTEADGELTRRVKKTLARSKAFSEKKTHRPPTNPNDAYQKVAFVQRQQQLQEQREMNENMNDSLGG
jgi:hypothetical protein